MVVRKLELSDLEQILLLRIGIQDYDLRYVNNEKELITKEELIKKTEQYLINNLNKTLYMFGVFIDNELVSNCGFYIDQHFPTYNNSSGLIGYICNVFTRENYRRRGYQRKVFEKCFEYAKNMGIIKFKLDSMNPDAINMYKSFGFSKNENIYSLRVKL